MSGCSRSATHVCHFVSARPVQYILYEDRHMHASVNSVNGEGVGRESGREMR